MFSYSVALSGLTRKMAAAKPLKFQTDEHAPMARDEKIRIKSKSGKIYHAYITAIYEDTRLGIEVAYTTKGGRLGKRLIPWEKIMECVRRGPTSDDDEDGWGALFESEADESDLNAPRPPEPTPAQRGYISTATHPQPHTPSIKAAAMAQNADDEFPKALLKAATLLTTMYTSGAMQFSRG